MKETRFYINPVPNTLLKVEINWNGSRSAGIISDFNRKEAANQKIMECFTGEETTAMPAEKWAASHALIRSKKIIRKNI